MAPSRMLVCHWNALCAMSWGTAFGLKSTCGQKAAAKTGRTSLLQQLLSKKRLGLAPWREYADDYRKMEIATSGYRMGELWDERGLWVNRYGQVSSNRRFDEESILH